MLSIIKISVLLSQGIPFIHADQGFFGTKGGVENSYNANDSVNKVDWKRKSKNEDINVEVEKGNPWSVLVNKYNELERTGLIYSQRTSGRFITEDINMINRIKVSLARDKVCEFINGMKNMGFSKDEVVSMVEEIVKEEK